MTRLEPGDIFAGLRVVDLLGEGGMGAVYLVENQTLGRQEALKLIRADSGSGELVHRFRNEAKVVAALDHPGIVTIYNYGVEGGVPWFTMQYLAGTDLLTKGPQPPSIVTQILTSAASALDYAHSRGAIHRDIKPANISTVLAADGSVSRTTLLDFGIARLMGQTRMTVGNAVMGSVAYSAPETLLTGESGPRSDQYALACTMFEYLTGEFAVSGGTIVEIMGKHMSGPVPLPSVRDPRLSPYDAVFSRALAKNPRERFPICGAFAEAFAAVGSQPDSSPPVMPKTAVLRSVERATEVIARKADEWEVSRRVANGRESFTRLRKRRGVKVMLVVAVVGAILAGAASGGYLLYEEFSYWPAENRGSVAESGTDYSLYDEAETSISETAETSISASPSSSSEETVDYTVRSDSWLEAGDIRCLVADGAFTCEVEGFRAVASVGYCSGIGGLNAGDTAGDVALRWSRTASTCLDPTEVKGPVESTVMYAGDRVRVVIDDDAALLCERSGAQFACEKDGDANDWVVIDSDSKKFAFA